MTDLYETLGIDKSATKSEIKSAYRSLAQKHHPDRQDGDADRFKAIQAAYDVLSNDVKREEYDKTGSIPGVQSIDSMALEMISSFAMQAMEKNGFAVRNYIPIVDAAIKSKRYEAKDAIRSMDKRLSSINRLLDSFEAAAMTRPLEHKKSTIESGQAQAKQAIEIMDAAIIVLEGYRFTGQVQIPNEVFNVRNIQFACSYPSDQ